MRHHHVVLVWLLGKLCAAIHIIKAARFFVGRVFDERTLPPLMRLSGQSRSQEQKADSVEIVRDQFRSGLILVST